VLGVLACGMLKIRQLKAQQDQAKAAGMAAGPKQTPGQLRIQKGARAAGVSRQRAASPAHPRPHHHHHRIPAPPRTWGSDGVRVRAADVGELDFSHTDTISIALPNPDDLMNIQVFITPDEGLYVGGRFQFSIAIPAAYPHEPPKCHCDTKVRGWKGGRPQARAECQRRSNGPRSSIHKWGGGGPAQVYHPNIDLSGNVCLNILREEWKPILSISAVVYGLQFLFLVRASQPPPPPLPRTTTTTGACTAAGWCADPCGLRVLRNPTRTTRSTNVRGIFRALSVSPVCGRSFWH
jgi:ubiquitin-protein ligase